MGCKQYIDIQYQLWLLISVRSYDTHQTPNGNSSHDKKNKNLHGTWVLGLGSGIDCKKYFKYEKWPRSSTGYMYGQMRWRLLDTS